MYEYSSNSKRGRFTYSNGAVTKTDLKPPFPAGKCTPILRLWDETALKGHKRVVPGIAALHTFTVLQVSKMHGEKTFIALAVHLNAIKKLLSQGNYGWPRARDRASE